MSCARTAVERQSRAIAASNAFISDPQYAYFPIWRGQAVSSEGIRTCPLRQLQERATFPYLPPKQSAAPRPR